MIWLLDRVIRAARIVFFNPVFWKTSAQITYNADAHMIRLTIPVSSSLYKIEPGTFYYLMVLNKWNFWESHPFTVAWISGKDQCAASESSPLLRHRSCSSEAVGLEYEKSQCQMTFLIRPYDSFTSRLKGYAIQEEPKPAEIRVAVDGPYGKTLPLAQYNNVLFIVGGSGIAVPLSYLSKLTNSDTRPRIEVHWAVRQSALALDVLQRELSHVLGNDQVKASIYVSGTSNARPIQGGVGHNAEWRDGRLNVVEIIDSVLNTGGKGSLAVVTSGPAKMADESRMAVAARTVSCLPQIQYFEESFQW